MSNNAMRSPDKNREIKKMLSMATVELRAAGINLFAPRPLLEDSLFHCQTALEKVFVAYLIFKGVPFEKTENFKKLAERCMEADPEFSQLCAQVQNMRVHPRNVSFKTDEEEVKSVIITAEKAFQKVVEKMPLEFFKK